MQYLNFKTIIMFVFIFASANLSAENISCCNTKDSFACLKNNFKRLYHQNNAEFNKILDKQEKKIQTEKSIKTTSNFLELAKYIEGNAEIAEWFGEIVDEMVLTDTKFFLDSSVLLDDEVLKILVDYYLKSPITGQDLEKAIAKYKNNSKYKKIMKLYYKKA